MRPFFLLLGSYQKIPTFIALLAAASMFSVTGGLSQANEGEGELSQAILGKKVDSFQLTDFRGKDLRLDEFQSADVLVVAFLGVECPLAKLYTKRLQELNDKYADDGRVQIIGVDANLQDSLQELAAHARRFDVTYPLAKDPGQQLAQSLGATRTPEVFVLDQNRTVRYFGRIDDQYGIGYVRNEPETRDLDNAIAALLNSHAIEVPHQPAIGCVIGKSKQPNPDATVTYSNQIARIFKDHCVKCHREGEIGPFALTDYSEIAGWAEMILEVVEDKRMPPWHANPEYGKFSNDCSLEQREIDLIRQWVEEGAAEGDPAELPEPDNYVTGWQLPQEPEVVLNVSPEPFLVPAAGDVRYQYFRADFDYSEDKWIKAAQLLPGSRPVVHHILVFVRPKGTRGGLGGERGFLLGYVPGSYATIFPEGMAKRVPAGSELIFQVHYTPVGTEQFDQSKLGIIFADPEKVEYEVKTTSAVNTRFQIPPNDGNYEVTESSPVLPKCEILNFAPHMHLRGKSFRYTAIYPDGTKERLIDVPEYDFNWQTAYRLQDPISLPEGTTIFCEAAFDNSAENLNNPNPNESVRWGDQTYEEMMIGYFDIVLPVDSSRKELIKALNKRGGWRFLAKAFDKNEDGKIERAEVDAEQLQKFDLLDSDRDGIIREADLEAR